MIESLFRPKTLLEETIYRLYQYLNIRYPHEIDLDIIAEACHTEIIRTPCRSRAYSHPIKKDWMLIQLDSLLTKVEQREHLAHEILHCLIHAGNQLCLPISFIKLQECQARTGAGHLLMPLWMVTELDPYMDRMQLAQDLAHRFNVSVSFADQRLQLMERRIEELWSRRDFVSLRSTGKGKSPYDR